MTHKSPRELIVVARDVDHVAAFASAAQQLLNHIVVSLGPIPFAAQLPAVDDVAHEVQVVTGVGFEEFDQSFGLASRCAQMQIGDKNSAVMHPVLMGTKVSGAPANQARLLDKARQAYSIFVTD
jgi:hypothetical protein